MSEELDPVKEMVTIIFRAIGFAIAIILVMFILQRFVNTNIISATLASSAATIIPLLAQIVK